MNAREVKNQLCIEGHTNAALDAVMRANSPDEVMCLLTAFGHKAVDMAAASEYEAVGIDQAPGDEWARTRRTGTVACKHCGGTTGYDYQSKRMQLTSFRGKWGEAPVALKTSVNVTESFASCCDCGVKYRVPALERGGLAGKPNV